MMFTIMHVMGAVLLCAVLLFVVLAAIFGEW